MNVIEAAATVNLAAVRQSLSAGFNDRLAEAQCGRVDQLFRNRVNSRCTVTLSSSVGLFVVTTAIIVLRCHHLVDS